MPIRPPSVTPRHWLLRLLAFVAITAQLVLALAPLSEGRSATMATHVETSGAVRGHYAHNEATCPVCQARSIHGATPKEPAPFLAGPIRPTAVVDVVTHGISDDYSRQANPRAPPASV